MAKRTQPNWNVPDGTEQHQLKLFNSLTRQKEVFVPQKGRRVLWYSCGPTVYDASHMGHARSYISFDIMRRVLADYFNYDVMYVMNITDIDDKIIKRARQNYLYDEYLKQGHSLDKILDDSAKVLEVSNLNKVYIDVILIIWQQFASSIKGTDDQDKKTMMEGMLAKVSKAVENLEKAVKDKNGELIKEQQQVSSLNIL